MLALVERLGAAVDVLLALGETVLQLRDFLAALLLVSLGLGLHLEDLVLGLDERFFLERLGLLLGVLNDSFSVGARTRRAILDEEPIDSYAEGDADDCGNQSCYAGAHRVPLLPIGHATWMSNESTPEGVSKETHSLNRPSKKTKTGHRTSGDVAPVAMAVRTYAEYAKVGRPNRPC